MNTRATMFTLFALVIAGMPFSSALAGLGAYKYVLVFLSVASAAPSPSPIDADTANVIAVNDNLACSSGSCNTTIAETNATNSTPATYPSAASALQDAWSPFTFLAVGGLALSTGML